MRGEINVQAAHVEDIGLGHLVGLLMLERHGGDTDIVTAALEHGLELVSRDGMSRIPNGLFEPKLKMPSGCVAVASFLSKGRL